jgi:hypothetical protein
MRRTFLAAFLVLAGCHTVTTAPTAKDAVAPASWLQPPTDLGTWNSWEEIPESDYFEVPASRLEAAQHDLSNSQFLPQEPSDVTHYGGRGFKCEVPARAYLIRALYVGGDGRYTLYWAKSSLIVAHDSLGYRRPLRESALVACLTRVPTAVYGKVGSDL